MDTLELTGTNFPGLSCSGKKMLIDKLNYLCTFLYRFILLDINFNPILVSLSNASCFKSQMQCLSTIQNFFNTGVPEEPCETFDSESCLGGVKG